MIVDEIFNGLDARNGLTERFVENYRGCVKVNVQNVSEYYYSNPQEQWHSPDFPCTAPPWQPTFWMEWRSICPMVTERPRPDLLRIYRYEEANGIYKVFVPPETRAVMALVTEPAWVKQYGARWMYRCRFFDLAIPGVFVFEYLFFVSPEGILLEVPGSPS